MAEISVLLEDGLRALYARCRRETGFRQRRLLDAIDLYGPVEAALRILRSPSSEDFDRLCELRRPDLTVEAFVLSLPDHVQLFSPDELAAAASRLESCQALVFRTRIAER